MNLFRKSPNWSNFFGLDDSGEYNYSEKNNKINESDNSELSFGDVLKKYRKDQNLTALELAERANISQSYISQIENNLKIPSEVILEKLAYGLVNYNNEIFTNNVKTFSDQNHEEQYLFFLEKLKLGKNLTRIKDMPLILRRDDYLVESEEIDEVISLFNSLSIEQQENAITYMKFLKNQ